MAMSGPAWAHPHIFIDAKATVRLDEKGNLERIEHSWTFDETFSAWQIEGLDTNGDGVTSSEEMQGLADENLVDLAEYGFYTFAGPGEQVIPLVAAGPARFVNENGRSTLFFSVQAAEATPVQGDFVIAISDPEYYVGITFADPSTVTLANAAGCSLSFRDPVPMSDTLYAQLYSLPPDVTKLPPELAVAARDAQGAIVVTCAGGTPKPAIVRETATAMERGAPFGGPPAEPGLILPRVGLLGWIAEVQAGLYAALNDALARLKTDGNAFWVIGGLSFLYGVLHAAGPGHGKIVISSYALANESQMRVGIALSFAAALLQSVIAIGLVLAGITILGLGSAAIGAAADWIGIASYALVAGLGLWLIIRKLFFRHSHRHGTPRPNTSRDARQHLFGTAAEPADEDAHDHAGAHPHMHKHDGSGHDHHHAHAVTPDQVGGDWRSKLAVVLGAGLRPCSGALIVMVFALSQSMPVVGMISVLLMGLGTGITVAALATFAVSAKGLAARWSGHGTASILFTSAELLGAFAVFAFGMVLLLASL